MYNRHTSRKVMYVVYVFVKMFECASEHLVHLFVDRDTNLGYFNGVK